MKRDGSKNMRRGYPAFIIAVFALCMIAPSFSAFASEQSPQTPQSPSVQASAVSGAGASQGGVKVSCNVVYQPGDHGTFPADLHVCYVDDATPAFAGTLTHESGYTFAGWSPSVAGTVSAASVTTYTAQWTQDAVATSASAAAIVGSTDDSAGTSDAMNSDDDVDGVSETNATDDSAADATVSQTTADASVVAADTAQQAPAAAVEIPENETALASGSSVPTIGFPWGLAIAFVSMVFASAFFLAAYRRRRLQWH